MNNNTIVFGVLLSIYFGMITVLGLRTTGTKSFYMHSMINAVIIWMAFYTALYWQKSIEE